MQDTTAPVIEDLNPPAFEPPTGPYVLAANQSSFQLFWGPFGVSDADDNLDVSCSVGVLDPARPLYTFVYDFPVGDTVVTCTATDSNGFSDSASFTVTIADVTPPVITLLGDPTVTLDAGSGPYVDPGATAQDNGDGDISASIVIDASGVDTNVAGTYTVFLSVSDSSGNSAELTRTVIVEFAYAGSTGISVGKTTVKIGSSVPLLWAWLGPNGVAVDSSGDPQLLSIEVCSTGEIVLQVAGDPGSSGFRYKSDNYWQFNWQSAGVKGVKYCAIVESGLTGQRQSSPPIRLR